MMARAFNAHIIGKGARNGAPPKLARDFNFTDDDQA
jgi:hypothetical protein